jgi:hypothetical protein
MSWDRTWAGMLGEMRRRAVRRSALRKRPVAMEATHAGV